MIYEYQCRSCGRVIEIRQDINATSKRSLYCPECERMRSVKKLISESSFILRGNGWAKDGYAGEKS